MAAALVKAQGLVSSNPLVVFSKTYCPYCVKVKELLTQLGAKQIVIELDIEGDGYAIQSALAGWTGQRTVPNVFIGGKHIGGCDGILAILDENICVATYFFNEDTVAKHKSGNLVPLLKQAGAL